MRLIWLWWARNPIERCEQKDQGKRLLQFRCIAEGVFVRLQTKALVEQGFKECNGTLSLVSEIIDKALKALREVVTP
jgi:hypothetical protein